MLTIFCSVYSVGNNTKKAAGGEVFLWQAVALGIYTLFGKKTILSRVVANRTSSSTRNIKNHDVPLGRIGHPREPFFLPFLGLH